MAESKEKVYAPSGTDGVNSELGVSTLNEQRYPRPKGLYGLYSNPITQVFMLGFVCFMCPGLFNALNGLGGGGQVDPAVSANANSALYASFAFFAFFAGYVDIFLYDS